MVKLYEHGIYLLGGTQIAESEDEAEAITGRRREREPSTRMTTCLDCPLPKNTAASMYRLTLQSSISLCGKRLQAAAK